MSTVVITGGSRGIGRAAVELFAQKGHRVFFLYEKNDAAATDVAGKTGATPIRGRSAMWIFSSAMRAFASMGSCSPCRRRTGTGSLT